MKEIREILNGTDFEALSLKEAGITVEIEENGSTFEENALLKAEGIRDWCRENGIPSFPQIAGDQVIVLADDSGLEVDALNKEPGIYSARYLGHDTSYREKNANIIARLDGVSKERRTARFVCAIAAAFPDGTSKTALGTIEGYIGWEERGQTALAMIRFFICMKTTVPRQSFRRRRKMRSATGAGRLGR